MAGKSSVVLGNDEPPPRLAGGSFACWEGWPDHTLSATRSAPSVGRLRNPAAPMRPPIRSRPMGRVLAVVVLLAVLVAGCGGGEVEQQESLSFDDLVASGASCQRLFDVRNSWPPDSPLVVEANETLRSIGCFSSSSTRTDQG